MKGSCRDLTLYTHLCRRELLEHTGPSSETALAATALVAVVASAAVLHHHHELRQPLWDSSISC